MIHTTFGPQYAVVNLSKIGLRYFRIGILVDADSRDTLIQKLIHHPNVGWIFTAEGYCNLAIGLWAKDNSEINHVSSHIRSLLTSSDVLVFQSEVTSLYSFGNRPITGNSAPMCIVDSTLSTITLSPLQSDYIKLITLDYTYSDAYLATLLNVSEVDIAGLKKDLVAKGVIVGRQERMQYGGTYYKLFIDSSTLDRGYSENKLITDLYADNACIYLVRANDKYNIECELVVENVSELEKYTKHISDYKIITMTENVYTNLYPVSKVANVKAIADTLFAADGPMIDMRNSKLWYLNYDGAQAYLDIYTKNAQYKETMGQGEVKLFPELVEYLKHAYPGTRWNIGDIGAGNGMKARAFAEILGEENVKSYYPIDIQPIELAAAVHAHAGVSYAVHPVLLDIENLGSRFPLPHMPQEKDIQLFLGGTYGNFQSRIINPLLRVVVREGNLLVVIMPIFVESKSDVEIMNSYRSESVNTIVFSLMSQLGFVYDDFTNNPRFPEMISHMNIEDRRLVTSLNLSRDVKIENKIFRKGTQFKCTTSWKPTLEQFKSALEEHFIIDTLLHNEDMALAVISRTK